MDLLLRFSAAVDAINRWINNVAIWLILVCAVLSATVATLRYAFNWGHNGLLEAQWFMFGLVFLFCAAYTLQQGGHVRIDIVAGKLSPRTRVWIDIVCGFLFLLPVCLLITVDSWRYFLIAFAQNERSNNPGGLYWWPIKGAIPVAFALLALQGLSEIIKNIASLTGHRPMPVFHKEGH
ncbi:TRAP-type mannitol/chloroaromatic compound transport system permease small subunit [Plasticicumulans lactativorans]|uniref:TRAP transporter small permease protein n=1 Tax=Plasticicumulans lactativorans TaxID=1133106 RepID=A0A4R2LSD8_9GAMM|nr:TRAP transporter small permease subunit [Plasticicumulans lactativorans]TCO82668.1 TRAP-type mannitol/chloroaromatic compound transport system permease small subunit [Plasticicumulans lactativorans]